MRVVLDTNVLASGALSPHGPPGRILDFVVAGGLTVLHDDRILAEYREVLLRPRFGLAADDVAALLAHVEWAGEYVAAALLDVDLPDPDDLPFLEVASAGMASALVTGNERHFKPARGAHDVPVVSPRSLLELLRP